MAAFTAMAIIGGVSAAIQAYQAHKAGAAQKAQFGAQAEAANSQADLADYNAGVADTQAKDAIQVGADQESRFRIGVRQMIGAQRASMAASNVDIGTGSAADVQADAAYLGELDAAQIRNNAARSAWGFASQAYDLRQRAVIMRKTGVADLAAGRAAQSAGNLAAVGAVVGAGASLAQARYGFGRAA